MEGLVTCEDCKGSGIRYDDRDVCRACMGDGRRDPFPLTLGEAVAELICREIDGESVGPELRRQISAALPVELGDTSHLSAIQVLHGVMLWLAVKDGKESDAEESIDSQ